MSLTGFGLPFRSSILSNEQIGTPFGTHRSVGWAKFDMQLLNIIQSTISQSLFPHFLNQTKCTYLRYPVHPLATSATAV
jgi:hypothetical protein